VGRLAMNDEPSRESTARSGRLSSTAMVNISVELSLILPVSGYTMVSVLRYRRQTKMTGNPMPRSRHSRPRR